MIRFDISDKHAVFLADVINAARRQGHVTDGTMSLVREGNETRYVTTTAASGAPLLTVPSLPDMAANLNLDLDNASHRSIMFGFRNPVARDVRGESWLPGFLSKIVRTSMTIAVRADDPAFDGAILLKFGPNEMVAQSVDSASGTLCATINVEKFKHVVAHDGGRKEWRQLLNDGLRFSDQPFWLKMLLKLI